MLQDKLRLISSKKIKSDSVCFLYISWITHLMVLALVQRTTCNKLLLYEMFTLMFYVCYAIIQCLILRVLT